MDFHSLARKDLQALCKKNKIPANMTNVAMTDALKALEKVEGLDELVNAQQSPERNTNGEPRTACRTSIRRNPVNVEPESSQNLTRTRRTTRTVAQESEQENKNGNLPETPAVPTTRRRATAASARRKIDIQLIEVGKDEKPAVQETRDVSETPAVRSSRSKAPAVSTRRKVVTQKDEKSAQIVYSTRQSARLLEKSMAELSLKEKREVQPVKIEGLCEETEEIEQAKDLPDESLLNESENHEVQEDSKTIDHEMDDSEAVSCRNLDQLLENESEMKRELNEDKRDDCEVDSGDLCQNMDQFPGSQSETELEFSEDSKDNGSKLENGHVTCTNSDNLSGLDGEDDNGSSDKSFVQVETSDKAINMNQETIDEKVSDIVITESSEMSNAALEPETEKESNVNQYSLIAEKSYVTEAEHISTVNVPDEGSIKVVDSLNDKVTEVVGERSEMNLMEDEQHESHDLNLKDAIEENDGRQDIEESSDGNGSDNDQIAKVEIRNEPESPEDKYNTDDINVIDAQNFDVIAHDCDTSSDPDNTPGSVQQKTPSCPRLSDSGAAAKISSAEDHLVPAEDFSGSAGIGIQTFDKSPTSLKKIIPYQPINCEDKVSCGMVSLPFATNTIQGQFPRPPVATPRKSSIMEQITVQKIILEDINKENFDASGGKVEPKKDKVKKTASEEDKILYEMSLRQLTKALKEKLQIKNNEARNIAKVGTRTALQILPENCAADAEPEHKN